MTTGAIRHLDRSRAPEGTSRVYLRASLLTLAGNVVLAIAKALVARASGSQAIYADTINSITDVAFSLLMVVVLRLALQPADDSHPHGHGRFEPLVSLTIGVMMALAGAEAVRSAVRVLMAGSERIEGIWPLIIPGATMVLKAGMYWQVSRMGGQVRSPALMASARDNLSDILTAAVVLVGVGRQRPGRAPGRPYRRHRCVSLDLSQCLPGAFRERSPSGGRRGARRRSMIRCGTAIVAVPGVLSIDQLIIEYVGPQVRADIHIIMDSQTTLQRVHLVSHAVRDAVEALPGVDHAFIHVEPLERLP